MEYIHKLPFMLGAFMAIVIGAVSYKFHVSQQETYIRMAICMVVFYTLGLFIRSTITRILEEVTRKKEEEIKEREEIERQKLEEAKNNEDATISNASKFDFKIDDQFGNDSAFGEDFLPLTVKEILKSGNEE